MITNNTENGKPTLKITDFGLSRKLSNTDKDYSRTLDITIPISSSAIETLQNKSSQPIYRYCTTDNNIYFSSIPLHSSTECTDNNFVSFIMVVRKPMSGLG